PFAQGDQGRQGRVGARLPVPMRVRRRGEAGGFQATDLVGRRARAVAQPRPAQCGDGRHVPGGVPQVPQGAPPERLVTERLWAALAEVQDPEMPINLVDLGVIYAITE